MVFPHPYCVYTVHVSSPNVPLTLPIIQGFDTNESRFNNLHSTFDKEREAMEEMLISVKTQVIY